MHLLGRQFGVVTCRRSPSGSMMDCHVRSMHIHLAGPGDDRSRKGNSAMLAYAAAHSEASHCEVM
jgi:hypothetical protein